MCVLHSCDNPPCINVAHLHLGTRTENSAEMVARGRSGKGVKHSQARLDDLDILAIREGASLGFTHRRLGEAFGVSRSAITAIVARKRWAHVGIATG
jgi:hypothetical protein